MYDWRLVHVQRYRSTRAKCLIVWEVFIQVRLRDCNVSSNVVIAKLRAVLRTRVLSAGGDDRVKVYRSATTLDVSTRVYGTILLTRSASNHSAHGDYKPA